MVRSARADLAGKPSPLIRRNKEVKTMRVGLLAIACFLAASLAGRTSRQRLSLRRRPVRP